MGQGEVGVVTHRVLCAWQLLGLAVKAMVGTGWANSRPGCMSRLRKRYSHLSVGSFSGREGCLGSKGVFANRECSLLHAR